MRYDTKDGTALEYSMIDRNQIQEVQDYFCAASNIYAVCVSRKHGAITAVYGTKEEREWLGERVDEKYYSILRDKLNSSAIEEVAEEWVYDGRIKICGVSVKVNQKIVATWLLAGIIKEKEDATKPYPDYIMTTSEERFDKAVKFLITISKQYLAAKSSRKAMHPLSFYIITYFLLFVSLKVVLSRCSKITTCRIKIT